MVQTLLHDSIVRAETRNTPRKTTTEDILSNHVFANLKFDLRLIQRVEKFRCFKFQLCLGSLEPERVTHAKVISHSRAWTQAGAFNVKKLTNKQYHILRYLLFIVMAKVNIKLSAFFTISWILFYHKTFFWETKRTRLPLECKSARTSLTRDWIRRQFISFFAIEVLLRYFPHKISQTWQLSLKYWVKCNRRKFCCFTEEGKFSIRSVSVLKKFVWVAS